MDKWIKIAFRNILKNKRRSLVTLLAIGIGFAAIILFRGYTYNIYNGLRAANINGQGLGHMAIFKQGWLEKGRIDPAPYLLSQQELETIRDVVEADDDVMLATPQLAITGLVSNGRISTVFLAKGVVPNDDRTITGAWTIRRNLQGEAMNGKTPSGVEVAQELANILEVKPGDYAVAMASTMEGQLNALDMDVSGVYDTGLRATNDKSMRVPFTYAQSLYDTDGADRVVVLLDDWQKTHAARERFLQQLTAAGIKAEIETWEEQSAQYTRVRGLFDTIFMFISIIVLVIVAMSVINTMSMAVLERTREIGTLRALGLKRLGVSRLFATEGVILGALGIATGYVISVIGVMLVRYLEVSWTPPANTTPVTINVTLVPQYLAQVAAFLLILSLLAAILPARHAAKQNVVQALGHV